MIGTQFFTDIYDFQIDYSKYYDWTYVDNVVQGIITVLSSNKDLFEEYSLMANSGDVFTLSLTF